MARYDDLSGLPDSFKEADRVFTARFNDQISRRQLDERSLCKAASEAGKEALSRELVERGIWGSSGLAGEIEELEEAYPTLSEAFALMLAGETTSLAVEVLKEQYPDTYRAIQHIIEDKPDDSVGRLEEEDPFLFMLLEDIAAAHRARKHA